MCECDLTLKLHFWCPASTTTKPNYSTDRNVPFTLSVYDAAALITRVNCAIVCLRLSLPAPVCRPLPRAKRTMKSILFCEWHRWMIDRYPSLSVTHTARGLSPPVCTFIEEHRNTYTQAHTQIRYHGKLQLVSLSTHTEKIILFTACVTKPPLPSAIDCSYLSYFNGDYCNHGCAREGRADSITWKWMQFYKCVCLGLYRECS